jgi:hypothetical protein
MKYIEILESNGALSARQIIEYIKKYHKEQNLHSDYIEYLDSFSRFILKRVPVNSLKINLPGLDKVKVEQYKTMDFSKSPPIVIDQNGNIIDGYHRANVAKSLSIPTILAYVGYEQKV